MWRCPKCNSEIDGKYLHCWQCGTKHVSQPTKQQRPVEQIAVPGFESYEDLAKVPKDGGWLWRIGPGIRIFAFMFVVLLAGIFKVLASPFIGAYGTYVVLAVGVGALLFILWRSFRRDPTEDVGIKLD